MKEILIVDDDANVRELIKDITKELAYMPVLAENGLEALQKFRNQKFDLVITDLGMAAMDGAKLIEAIRNSSTLNSCSIPILIVTGQYAMFSNKLALDENVVLLEKPFTTEEIKNVCKSILEPRQISDKAGKKFIMKRGGILIKEGDLGRSMYWLQKGSLLIYKTNEGKEVKIGNVLEGELVGEISFLDERPRSASVRCETDCEIVEIPYSKFINEVNNRPAWFKRLIKTLCERLRKADRQII